MRSSHEKWLSISPTHVIAIYFSLFHLNLSPLCCCHHAPKSQSNEILPESVQEVHVLCESYSFVIEPSKSINIDSHARLCTLTRSRQWTSRNNIPINTSFQSIISLVEIKIYFDCRVVIASYICHYTVWCDFDRTFRWHTHLHTHIRNTRASGVSAIVWLSVCAPVYPYTTWNDVVVCRCRCCLDIQLSCEHHVILERERIICPTLVTFVRNASTLCLTSIVVHKHFVCSLFLAVFIIISLWHFLRSLYADSNHSISILRYDEYGTRHTSEN